MLGLGPTSADDPFTYTLSGFFPLQLMVTLSLRTDEIALIRITSMQRNDKTKQCDITYTDCWKLERPFDEETALKALETEITVGTFVAQKVGKRQLKRKGSTVDQTDSQEIIQDCFTPSPAHKPRFSTSVNQDSAVCAT